MHLCWERVQKEAWKQNKCRGRWVAGEVSKLLCLYSHFFVDFNIKYYTQIFFISLKKGEMKQSLVEDILVFINIAVVLLIVSVAVVVTAKFANIKK